MTHKLLISLGKESFSNITVDFEGTADEAIVEGKRLLEVVSGQPGLPTKEWAELRHRYFTGGSITPDEFYSLSPAQQFWVQETKKEVRNNK